MIKKVKAILTVEVHYEDESGTMSLDEMITEARAIFRKSWIGPLAMASYLGNRR